MRIGYFLSSEEYPPAELIEQARGAERAGFTALWISDHYHPWVDAQGQSAFVWSTIGALSQVCTLPITTAVTCPTVRIHPAVIAQAAATAAAHMPGRFFLGVGTGENLNEHILGDRWPGPDERLEMLQEAIEVMRLLWQGGYQTHRGKHYTVENARIYTLPEEPIPIMVAASGPEAAETAGRMADGFIGTSPESETIRAFEAAGGAGKPKYGQATVCWAEDAAEAVRTAHEIWPLAAVQGQLSQELPLPLHFEQAAASVTPEQVAQSVVCGPDPQRHIEQIQQYVDAGYTHLYVHQIGPDQEAFFRFAERELLPRLRD